MIKDVDSAIIKYLTDSPIYDYNTAQQITVDNLLQNVGLCDETISKSKLVAALIDARHMQRVIADVYNTKVLEQDIKSHKFDTEGAPTEVVIPYCRFDNGMVHAAVLDMNGGFVTPDPRGPLTFDMFREINIEPGFSPWASKIQDTTRWDLRRDIEGESISVMRNYKLTPEVAIELNFDFSHYKGHRRLMVGDEEVIMTYHLNVYRRYDVRVQYSKGWFLVDSINISERRTVDFLEDGNVYVEPTVFKADIEEDSVLGDEKPSIEVFFDNDGYVSSIHKIPSIKLTIRSDGNVESHEPPKGAPYEAIIDTPEQLYDATGNLHLLVRADPRTTAFFNQSKKYRQDLYNYNDLGEVNIPRVEKNFGNLFDSYFPGMLHSKMDMEKTLYQMLNSTKLGVELIPAD